MVYLIAVTVQVTGLLLLSVVSLTVAVVHAFAPPGSMLGATRTRPRQASSRPSMTTQRRASTDPLIQEKLGVSPAKPRKSRPSARTSAPNPRKAGKPKPCTVKCRQSSGYVEDCDCSCGGSAHGSERPGGPLHKVTKAQLRSRTMIKRERQHVKRIEKSARRG